VPHGELAGEAVHHRQADRKDDVDTNDQHDLRKVPAEHRANREERERGNGDRQGKGPPATRHDRPRRRFE
jgi:hypothetical protein